MHLSIRGNPFCRTQEFFHERISSVPFNRSGELAGAPGEVVRNKVLRNTYWLLALSLIPTVLGAAVGLYTGINRVMGASPGLSAIVFLVGAFGMMFAIEKNKNNSLGVVLLLAFTFFMGVMLSRLLGFVMGMSNGSQLVMTAFGGTAIVFGTMATLATTIKRDLSGMQKFLFMGAVVILVAALANIFLQLPALMLTISVMAIVIFSAFMLVDLQRVVNGGETNYVSATLAIYLDVQRLLEPADAAGHLRRRPRITASARSQPRPALRCRPFRPAHHDEAGLTPCRYSKKQQYQNPEHLRHARAPQ